MRKKYVVLAGAGALGLGLALAYATHKTKAMSSHTTPHTPPHATLYTLPHTTSTLIPAVLNINQPQTLSVGMVATLYYSGLSQLCKYQGSTTLNSPPKVTITVGQVLDSAGHPVSNVQLSFYPQSVQWSGDFYACYEGGCLTTQKVGSGTQTLTFNATPTDSNGNFSVYVTASNNVKINPPCIPFLIVPTSGYTQTYSNISNIITVMVKNYPVVRNVFTFTISPFTQTIIKSV